MKKLSRNIVFFAGLISTLIGPQIGRAGALKPAISPQRGIAPASKELALNLLNANQLTITSDKLICSFPTPGLLDKGLAMDSKQLNIKMSQEGSLTLNSEGLGRSLLLGTSQQRIGSAPRDLANNLLSSRPALNLQIMGNGLLACTMLGGMRLIA
jgi:hypothetical protein